jgi:NAD(P)-dependent dehydrogenase (short-subunit alcohol dehydrogenase family)
MSLSGKVALVTGGSRGIGKEIARLLAREGAAVVICARNIDGLRETASSISRSGGRCVYREADITDEGQVNAMAREVVRLYGRIDILINNAGVGVYKPLAASTAEDWETVMDTNLKGAFFCARVCSGIMMRQHSGIIVNVASGAGKKGFANLSIYCASKFGLLGLTDSLKRELKQYGIDVLAVTPGYTRTAFFEAFPDSFKVPDGAQKPREAARLVLKKIYGARRAGISGIVSFAKEKIWTQ